MKIKLLNEKSVGCRLVRSNIKFMTMGVTIGIGKISKFGQGENWSYTSGLALNHNAVSSNVFTESVKALSAKVLPSCFVGNGAGYFSLASGGGAINITHESVIDIDFALSMVESTAYIPLLGATSATQTRWTFRYNSASDLYDETNTKIASFASTAWAEAGYKVGKLRFNAGVITLFVNGTGYANATVPPATWTLSVDYIGRISTSYFTSTSRLYYISFSGVAKWYFNNIPLETGANKARIYDTIGGGHLFPLGITSTNIAYDVNAPLHPFTKGYSLWQKEGSADIQVPYSEAGAPISLTAGTNIPAGYTKTRDLAGSVHYWNMADARIGFNETESADADLEIFDRANATRQTETSRASAHYDAATLASRSRYHITEIADPRIYFTYFNAGYKGLLFGKISTVLNDADYDIVAYSQQLKYKEDQKGANENRIMMYCGLGVFRVLDGGGKFTTDGDGYVIIS